jgi:ADP-ribosylglycohydrolase
MGLAASPCLCDRSRVERDGAAAAARASLLGLAVGDALGATLDRSRRALDDWTTSRLAPSARPWRWTDDTAMAVSVVELLVRHGALDVDELAAAFVQRFTREPDRGYGAAAHSLLLRVSLGAAWRDEAARPFGGQGSFGNGAAMRAAPIGAYVAPDLERVRAEALRSAQPTHAHPDGAAGAVAVAIAAAVARRDGRSGASMIAEVVQWTPPGLTRDGLARAAALDPGVDVEDAGRVLGTGGRVSSPDTVPLAIWIAARHLGSYPDALWAATALRGLDLDVHRDAVFAVDRDTVGAIVGGIVVCATGVDGIPTAWRDAIEPLPG